LIPTCQTQHPAKKEKSAGNPTSIKRSRRREKGRGQGNTRKKQRARLVTEIGAEEKVKKEGKSKILKDFAGKKSVKGTNGDKYGKL